MNLAISKIADLVNGDLVGDDLKVSGVSTDTRSMKAGELFIALVGESFDPHELIVAHKADTAGAVMVESPLSTDIPQIVVNNTYLALQEFAKAWRKNFSIPIVGITGSCGKTSVKELIKQILSSQGSVLATCGNLNNHIGVPLTLLQLREEHVFGVIEMGANHAGEIELLSKIAKPDIGVITNIGPAHLEGFGSVEGVALAKAELYQNLNPKGIAVINNDEAYLELWKEPISDRMQITFSIENKSDVLGKVIDLNLVEISTPIGDLRVQLQSAGRHDLYNALAATAVCIGLGIDLEEIKLGLEATKPVPGRLIRLKGIGGASIFDDSYNANPASLNAALHVQAQEEGEHWLVLGDMAELGSESIALHKKAADMAKHYGVSRLFGFGEFTQYTVDAFGAGAEHYSSHESLTQALQENLYEGVCVLVKGSRSMKLEKVVDGIRSTANNTRKCKGYAA